MVQWGMTMTLKARAAFELYRDLGPSRSLSRVAALQGRPPRRGQSQLARWSAKYEWVRLCIEHDHAKLRKALKARVLVRERATQKMIDGMDAAADVLLEIMLDRSRLPEYDRQGEQIVDGDGNEVYRYQVRASTRANCAEKVLGLGGLVQVKRTIMEDRSTEDVDEAAADMEAMHPDDLEEARARHKRRLHMLDDDE